MLDKIEEIKEKNDAEIIVINCAFSNYRWGLPEHTKITITGRRNVVSLKNPQVIFNIDLYKNWMYGD